MAVDGRLGWILVGAAGLLAGLSLPPLGWPPLAWIALAVLWAGSARASDSGSLWVMPRRRLEGPALWGALAVLVSHRWLLGLHPLDWIGVPLALSLPLCLLLLLLLSALGAGLVGAWSWLAARLDPARASTALLLAALWGLAEVLLARGPLFWLGLGSGALPHDPPLAGLAALLGSGGLAAVQVLLGWGLWRAVASHARRRRLAVAWLALVLLLHGLGAALLAWQPADPGPAERVLVLQPAIPTREKHTAAARQRLGVLLSQALEAAERQRAELVVLPEGALGLEPRLSVPTPVELLSGGFRWQERQDTIEQRSALLRFAPGDTQPRDHVDKHRLVPLGEWVPLAGWLRWSGLSAVGGVAPGEASRLLPRPRWALGVAICYELSDGSALAAATRAGATWLLASANLDPYPLMLQRQFEALARQRAIETGRWLVSAANTGPSLLVSPQGLVRERLPPQRPGMALVEPHPRSALTPYSRFGETALLGLGALGGWLRRRRRTSAGELQGDFHQGEPQESGQGEQRT